MTTKAETAAPIAKVCSWCSQPFTEQDRILLEAGALQSHGIDPACLALWFPDLAEGLAP